MRILTSLLLLAIINISYAQTIHYFRVQMGPKMENYKVLNNDNVKALSHVDVGAGLLVGKRFTENFYAEAGVFKNDYSAKFEITTKNQDGIELKSFSDQLYPTFSTAQAGIFGGYRSEYSEKWTWYAQGGVQSTLTKKLEREGSQFFYEIAKNEASGDEEQIEVITFSNGLGPGNLIFRADAGLYRSVSEHLAIDMSVSGRFSNLVFNEFEIEYFSQSEPQKKRAVLQNNAKSFSFSIGLKYKINDY